MNAKELTDKQIVNELNAITSIINDDCFGVNDLQWQVVLIKEAEKRGIEPMYQHGYWYLNDGQWHE